MLSVAAISFANGPSQVVFAEEYTNEDSSNEDSDSSTGNTDSNETENPDSNPTANTQQTDSASNSDVLVISDITADTSNATPAPTSNENLSDPLNNPNSENTNDSNDANNNNEASPSLIAGFNNVSTEEESNTLIKPLDEIIQTTVVEETKEPSYLNDLVHDEFRNLIEEPIVPEVPVIEEPDIEEPVVEHEHSYMYSPISSRHHKIICEDGDYEAIGRCEDEDHDGFCDNCEQELHIDESQKEITIVENFSWTYTLSSGVVLNGSTPQSYYAQLETDNQVVYTKEAFEKIAAAGNFVYDFTNIEDLDFPEELPNDVFITYSVSLDGEISDLSIEYGEVDDSGEEEFITKTQSDLDKAKEEKELKEQELLEKVPEIVDSELKEEKPAEEPVEEVKEEVLDETKDSEDKKDKETDDSDSKNEIVAKEDEILPENVVTDDTAESDDASTENVEDASTDDATESSDESSTQSDSSSSSADSSSDDSSDSDNSDNGEN